MIAVVQRVLSSSVEVNGKIVNKISNGLLIFLGVKKGDDKSNAEYLAKKAVNLRIFSDENEKMNLSVKDINGEILVISQFTLCTDNGKSGNRPSFIFAEEPEKANELYKYFLEKLKIEYTKEKIFSGIFSAYMKINLTNDGPVTILLEK
jgi:D-aminoacyl-tRNA deacylase